MAEKMVDMVTRLMKSPKNIRNIGVCAHMHSHIYIYVYILEMTCLFK